MHCLQLTTIACINRNPLAHTRNSVCFFTKADTAEDKEVESTNSTPILDGEGARNRPMRALSFFNIGGGSFSWEC